MAFASIATNAAAYSIILQGTKYQALWKRARNERGLPILLPDEEGPEAAYALYDLWSVSFPIWGVPTSDATTIETGEVIQFFTNGYAVASPDGARVAFNDSPVLG